MENIFANGDDFEDVDKVTYTQFIDSIPQDKMSVPISKWHNDYTKEWRWRIFDFGEKTIAEVSYLNKDGARIYYIPSTTQWATREVPDIYDKYVKEIYYAYE